jgi:hypothetical protein
MTGKTSPMDSDKVGRGCGGGQMGIFNKIKELFKRQENRRKKPGKRHQKHSGYRSPEEFHAEFKNRYGKPGRFPEDIAG